MTVNLIRITPGWGAPEQCGILSLPQSSFWYGQVQAKQELGTLYLCASHHMDGIDRRIAEAQEESSRTCEVCGQPGKQHEAGGWVRAGCDDHAEAKGSSQKSRVNLRSSQGIFCLSGKVTPADIGLPLYPGSKPYKDDSHDSQAAHVGLWGGGSGFNLAVMKMQTGELPEKDAAF
jgi:hypothetical protein